MRVRILFLGAVMVFVCVLFVSPLKADDHVERVFYNAKIFTGEPEILTQKL